MNNLDLFSAPFVLRALLAATMVGAVCGFIGVYVVLRRLAFVGDGIAHAAFAGIAIGVVSGLPPILSAYVFCSLVAVLIALTSNALISEDTSIGVFFAASMAVGMLLFSLSNVQFGDVIGVLFGSILQVTTTELFYGAVVLILVVVLSLMFQRQFTAIVFDEELAFTTKIPVKKIKILMFVVIALTVVSAVRLVGTVLVSALLIAPAATALIFANSLKASLLLSTALGAAISILGLFIAVLLDLPPSAVIALLSSITFLSAIFLRPAN